MAFPQNSSTQGQLSCAEYPYCPSLRLPVGGFAYQAGDAIDPLATIELNDCDGVNIGRIYPANTELHNLAVTDCSGQVIGYANIRSNCVAEDCGCDSVLLNPSPCRYTIAPAHVTGFHSTGTGFMLTMSDGTQFAASS